jgi:twitching motility protein PilI
MSSSTAAPQAKGGKSSLREFQQRLATRLSQSKDTQIASHLAVEVGKQHLLLPLAESGEITSNMVVQGLPHAKAWFLGVTVLRGQIVGVADLAVLLGERTTANTTGTFIGLAEALDVNCLLRVDKLVGLRTLDQYQPDTKMPVGNMGARYLDDQKLGWEVLSLASLSRDEQFLQVFR